MDITKSLEALKLSSSGPSKGSHDEPFNFLDFFKQGSAGRAIFTEHVIPFLTLEDLLFSGAHTCRQLNTMCRTYTVGEILSLHSMNDVPRHHKLELGKLIMTSLSPQYFASRIHRRLIRSATERYHARLYHPSNMTEILWTMTVYFNKHGIAFDAVSAELGWIDNADENTPLLVEAVFGDKTHGMTDVMAIMRFLLMKQGNTRLVLDRPPNGNQYLRYWYVCLFGDPCPRVTKTLWITTRSKDGEQRVHTIPEDHPLKMILRAERPVEGVSSTSS